jgi:hypothetical protein
VLARAGWNDISVSGDLLFLSTDSSRSDSSCSSTTQPATEKSSWEGMKVFDISDKRNPRYVAAVETACGSHTHTLVPERRSVSSYAPNAAYPDCRPPHDGISVIKVPRNAPEKAAVVGFPVLFPGEGPDGGGNPGGPRQPGRLQDHRLPRHHRAGLGGPGRGRLHGERHPVLRQGPGTPEGHLQRGDRPEPRCRRHLRHRGPNRGADGIYDIVGKGDERKLVFRAYFKISRHQADTENCVAHNGSLIPVKGRDLMVQAWYQGGVSVWEFTDSSKPREIAYFERGPASTDRLTFGGSWSAYYYNGYICSNEITKGFDVLKIKDRRTDPARWIHLRELNVQTQPDYFG